MVGIRNWQSRTVSSKLLPQLFQKSRLLDLIDIAIVIKCLGRCIRYRSTVDEHRVADQPRHGTDRFPWDGGIATELAKRLHGKFVKPVEEIGLSQARVLGESFLGNKTLALTSPLCFP